MCIPCQNCKHSDNFLLALGASQGKCPKISAQHVLMSLASPVSETSVKKRVLEKEG